MTASFEPTPIEELARYMRDGTWVDMRTPMGRAVRVRIHSLMVTREADELGIEQKWLGDDERLKCRSFSFDAEEIWDCGPTTVGLLDVTPLKGNAAPPEVVPDSIAYQDVADAVLDALPLLFDYLNRKDLVGVANGKGGQYVGGQYITHHRHQAIIAIYEMTDASPTTICTKILGYASPQPWVTARYKCHSTNDSPSAVGMRATIRNIDKLVTARLGSQRRRRAPVPQDYSPVLG